MTLDEWLDANIRNQPWYVNRRQPGARQYDPSSFTEGIAHDYVLPRYRSGPQRGQLSVDPNKVPGFIPYHWLVMPNGDLVEAHGPNEHAPHAYLSNQRSRGVAYYGDPGQPLTDVARERMRMLMGGIKDNSTPGFAWRTHGDAYEATKNTPFQASVDGRGPQEASWLRNLWDKVTAPARAVAMHDPEAFRKMGLGAAPVPGGDPADEQNLADRSIVARHPGLAGTPPPGPVENTSLPDLTPATSGWQGEMDSPPVGQAAAPEPRLVSGPQPADRWDLVRQQAIENQNKIDAQPPAGDRWDRLRQQAVQNQGRIDALRQSAPTPTPAASQPQAPQNAGWLGNMFKGGPFAGFSSAGSFFNAMDGSGFKDGGAVKSAKATAHYREHPNRGQRCGDCTMFRAPHGCTAVRGAISPYGWCDYYEPEPTAVARHIKKAEAQVNHAPSDAQKEAGNYAKGHVTVRGLDVTIENPKGSTRGGKDPSGKAWSVTMPATYGYIKRSEGSDGDHVDVYIGPDHSSQKVWCVDQIDLQTGKFDEHKCLLSFPTREAALAAYEKAFSDGKGRQRIGAVTELSVPAFKNWLARGDTKKPMGKVARASGGRVQNLDALSRGLGNFTPEELAAARAHREESLRTTPADEADMRRREQVHGQLGVWPERYIDISPERLQNIGSTLRSLDNQFEYRRADGGRAIGVARKYSRG